MNTKFRARHASLAHALVIAALSTGCSAAAGDAFRAEDPDASSESPPAQAADASSPTPDAAIVPTIDAGGQADASATPDAAEAGADGSDGAVESGSDAEAGVACAPGHVDCNGNPADGCEIDPSSDPKNCGACGHDCTALPHVAGPGVTCSAGVCVVPASACAHGFAHCSQNPNDGCEADLSQPAHCGSCAQSCGGSTPICANGACTNGCSSSAPTMCSGSCVDTTTSVSNCGACGNACSAPSHATASCTASHCAFSCNGGYHRCGSACADDTSPASCGSSCTPCVAPSNATATCNGTSCGFACNGGYHQCGGACADNHSTQTCGSSCTPCSAPSNATPTCDGTSCGFTCNGGYHQCGGACADNHATQTCGSSCTPCSAPANATPTCDGTSCGFTCNGGYHQCGGACADNHSTQTCGGSCTPCPVPANGQATCDGTSCGFSCNAGYHACGGACDGNNDVNSCGNSCTPCPVPANANPTCDGVKCGFTCKPGFADCDGNAANGCEVALASDGNNCNACGHGCQGGACSAGACQPVVVASSLAWDPYSITADANGAYSVDFYAVRQYAPSGTTRAFAWNGAIYGGTVANAYVYVVGPNPWAQSEAAGSSPFELNIYASAQSSNISVAAAGNYLYWAEPMQNDVQFAPNPADLQTQYVRYTPPSGFSVGAIAGNPYGVVWYETGAASRLMIGQAVGTTMNASPLSISGTPVAVAVPNGSTNPRYVVWATSDGSIWYAATNGTVSPTRIASGQSGVTEVSTDGADVFFKSGNEIRRASIASGAVQHMATAGNLMHLTQYGTLVYFYDASTKSLMKLAK